MMKLITLCCLGVFVLLLGSQPSAVDAAKKSYPIMCRGGGTMKGTFWPKGIKFHFVGASEGAGVRTPQAGQCTWLDRGFRVGEPREIVWHSRDLKGLSVKFNAQGKITQLTMKGKHGSQYQYLYNGIRNGRVFQLHAYQATCSGKKCPFLSTTRVGP